MAEKPDCDGFRGERRSLSLLDQEVTLRRQFHALRRQRAIKATLQDLLQDLEKRSKPSESASYLPR
jgi:hypothetical protein